jgi:hypothetical protein
MLDRSSSKRLIILSCKGLVRNDYQIASSNARGPAVIGAGQAGLTAAAVLSGAATPPQLLLREEALFRLRMSDECTSQIVSADLRSQTVSTA